MKEDTYENTKTFGRCYGCVWNGSADFIRRFSYWMYIFCLWADGYRKPQEGTDMIMMFMDSQRALVE